MQLACDRVAGGHALAYGQLAWELGGHLAVVAHLLVLAPHQLAPCLQLAPFLPPSKQHWLMLLAHAAGAALLQWFQHVHADTPKLAVNILLAAHKSTLLPLKCKDTRFAGERTWRKKLSDSLRGVPSAARSAAHSVLVSFVLTGMPTCLRKSCIRRCQSHSDGQGAMTPFTAQTLQT